MPGISAVKIGIPLSKKSGINWSAYWTTRLPYFALPATGVSLMVGQEVTIYGDALINVPIGNPLSVTYTCDIGTQVGNNLVITPVAGDIGDHSLSAVFKNGSYTVEDKTINLTVIAEAPAGTKGILMIGDSTMNGGADEYGTVIDAVLDSCTFTFLGTSGTTYKYEWVGTWANAIHNTIPTSKFVKAGSLDIEAYFTDNSIADPDYVFIRLGINDTFGHCAIAGDGLTDLEIAAIIADAKTFIDAFLAYDADLKIILGLPTLCDKDGVGWDIDYDTAVFSQDRYIENMHKYWLAFVTEFESGAYDARVDVSYEVIHLDRTNYPTSGVHPDSTGYTQLGYGMAFKINELLKADWIPTGVTAVWENDYAKIDFTDASGGAAQHEIWSSKDGEDYILVTTLDAATVTYNDTTWQNASMDYRVRARSGIWVSDYCIVVNLVTPLVFKTNQTALTNVIINSLIIGIGKTVNINWGDDTNADYTGTNTNITKGYGAGNEADPYYIRLSGDLNSITAFVHISQVKSYGDLTKWKLPTSLTIFNFNDCAITGDVTGWVLPSGLTDLKINGNVPAGAGLTGDVSAWVIPTGLTLFYFATPTTGNKVTGDCSSWILPTGLTRFYFDYQDITKLPRGAFVGMDAAIGFYVRGCNCNTSEVDSFLAYLDNYFTSVTPIKNSQYLLNATGMGIPSAAGLASRTSIQGKFTAAGYTATITVNS